MLGPKARAYADSSGNPIGITSEKAFENRYGKKAKKIYEVLITFKK